MPLQKKNEHRKAEGFQIVHFDWSFSSDIMAVKGLNHYTMMLEPVMCQEPVNRCTGIAYSLPYIEILEI